MPVAPPSWQNGCIERSNRTDKEELFNRFRFCSSEERKCCLKLWEYGYNYKRPHQGHSPACSLLNAFSFKRDRFWVG